MGVLPKLVHRQLPQRRQARIGKRQPSIGAEHGDRFGKRVDGFALDVGEGLVGGFKLQPLGDVLEYIDNAAGRTGRGGNHLDRAPVGQVPRLVFMRLLAPIGLEVLRAPGLVIDLVGQHAIGAQLVEDRPLVEAGHQKLRAEVPQLGISLVVLHQFTLGVEDRDGRRQRADDVADRDKGRVRGAAGVVGRRAQIAGAAFAQGEFNELKRPLPWPGQGNGFGLARAAGQQMRLELGCVEQFGRRAFAALLAQGLGQREIRRIGINQPFAGIAGKGGLGQARQNRPDAGKIGFLRFFSRRGRCARLGKSGAQAHGGAATQNPAIGADQLSFEAGEADGKGMAMHAQVFKQARQLVGVAVGQPG